MRSWQYEGHGDMKATAMSARETVKAILTDVQFWIPAVVLLGGVVLLVVLQ